MARKGAPYGFSGLKIGVCLKEAFVFSNKRSHVLRLNDDFEFIGRLRQEILASVSQWML